LTPNCGAILRMFRIHEFETITAACSETRHSPSARAKAAKGL